MSDIEKLAIEKLAQEIAEEIAAKLELREIDAELTGVWITWMASIIASHLTAWEKERGERIEQLETAFLHMHVAQDGLDACAHCGLDLRDRVHCRALEGETT